jgi:hypothetical protein
MCVTIDGVLDFWIYWPILGRNHNYNTVDDFHTLQITGAQLRVLSLLSLIVPW